MLYRECLLTVLRVCIRRPAAPWAHERRERHRTQDQQCRELDAYHIWGGGGRRNKGLSNALDLENSL